MNVMQHETTDIDFDIYTSGLCYMSVCVIDAMEVSQIETMANAANPTGIPSKWHVANESFKFGESNPCLCNEKAGRKHYLLTC